MPAFDDLFRLEVSTSICLEPTEPDEYMPKYKVNIMATDENDEYVFAGKMIFFKSVPLDAIDCSLHDVFDATNGDLADLTDILDENGNIDKPLESIFGGDDFYFSHIFYIHTIELLPKFRKIGLTKAVIEKLFEVFIDDEEYAIIFLAVCPMQKTLTECDETGSTTWDRAMEYTKMPEKQASVKKKLMEKYQKELGFRPTGVHNIMFRFKQAISPFAEGI